MTANKIFVLVGDLSDNVGPIELMNDQGFELPEQPILSTNELTVMKRKLKDEDFRRFFVSFIIFASFSFSQYLTLQIQHETDFCCPTNRSTDTATISKYLKRFISLRVRSKITLKENGKMGQLYSKTITRPTCSL